MLVPKIGNSAIRGSYLGLAYYQVLGRSWDTTVYADLFRYHELFGSLFRRDLRAKYKGSVLGVAWSLLKLCRKLKVKAIAYGYRHGFATDALAAGVPDAHVAALLGHGSTAMLHKHYSHLSSRATVLRDAAALVRADTSTQGE